LVAVLNPSFSKMLGAMKGFLADATPGI